MKISEKRGKNYLTEEYAHLHSYTNTVTTLLGQIIQHERSKKNLAEDSFADFINQRTNPFLPFKTHDIQKIEHNHEPLTANYYSLSKYEMIFNSLDMDFYEVLSWVQQKPNKKTF